MINPKTGTGSGVWYCETCRVVHRDQVAADECCGPVVCAVCGIAVERGKRRYSKKCEDCERSGIEAAHQRLLDEASEVTWDGSRLFCEENEKWYDDLDDIADDFVEGKAPKWVFPCIEMKKKFDLDSALEQMADDTYEDCEVFATDELIAAVEKFNAEHAVVYFEADYSKKVRVA